ncbi:endomucin [Oryx dammah]|uniref:endomucin n=1 Tax=Oryx dammah TaxID=59534 RepID=UPI001A9AA184|nr:endomucin [Oryx dammah]
MVEFQERASPETQKMYLQQISTDSSQKNIDEGTPNSQISTTVSLDVEIPALTSVALFKLYCAQESCQTTGSDSGGLKWNWQVYTFNKFSDDISAAYLGAALGAAKLACTLVALLSGSQRPELSQLKKLYSADTFHREETKTQRGEVAHAVTSLADVTTAKSLCPSTSHFLDELFFLAPKFIPPTKDKHSQTFCVRHKASTPSTPLSATSKVNASSPTINTSPNDEKSTGEISTEGISSKEPTQTPHVLSSPVTLRAEGDRTSTKNIMETKLSTTEATVMSQSLSRVVSTSQSSDSKTETQSSIKATETPVNTSPPEASSFRTTTLSSISVTTPENISPSQGLENAKNASASTTSPSYSSFILPMVIALIVITLSVFVLVGLYRMCWKTDPGTQENGNEQPQSDKESVKLLTVKTISHESGEHSAQGKTKN